MPEGFRQAALVHEEGVVAELIPEKQAERGAEIAAAEAQAAKKERGGKKAGEGEKWKKRLNVRVAKASLSSRATTSDGNAPAGADSTGEGEGGGDGETAPHLPPVLISSSLHPPALLPSQLHTKLPSLHTRPSLPPSCTPTCTG